MVNSEISVAGQQVKLESFLTRIVDPMLAAPVKFKFARKDKQKIFSAFAISQLSSAITEAFSCSTDDTSAVIAFLARKKLMKPLADGNVHTDPDHEFYFSSSLPLPKESLATADSSASPAPGTTTSPLPDDVVSPAPAPAASESVVFNEPTSPSGTATLQPSGSAATLSPDGDAGPPKRSRSMRDLGLAVVAKQAALSAGEGETDPKKKATMAVAAHAVNVLSKVAGAKKLKVGANVNKQPENQQAVAKRESKAQDEAKKRAFQVMTPRTWMLMPDSFFRWVFDGLLIVVIVLHSCLVSGRLVLAPDVRPMFIEIVVDTAVGGMYLVHFCLTLTTVVWHEEQHLLQTDFVAVAKQYARSLAMYADIIAFLPLATLAWVSTQDAGAWTGLRLVFIAKLVTVRTSRLFRSSNPILMGRGYVQFYFFLRPIIVGMAWGLLALHIATLIKVLISQQHLVQLSALRRGLDWDRMTWYGVSLFWVLNILGASVADHTLHNSLEFVYTSLLIVLSLIFQGAVVGQLALLVSQNSVQDTIGPTMRNTASLLAHYRIPESLQTEVLGFQHHQLNAESMNNDPFGVTGRLPKPMREQISLHMKANLLSRVPLLAKTSSRCKLLVAKKMTSLPVTPTTYIVTANERLEHMYFLQHGLCDVIVRGKVSKNLTLRRGDSFGQDSLIADSPSPYTIRALTFCDLFRLSAKDFKSIAEKVPELARLLYKPTKGQKTTDLLGNFKNGTKKKRKKAEPGAEGAAAGEGGEGGAAAASPPAEAANLPPGGPRGVVPARKPGDETLSPSGGRISDDPNGVRSRRMSVNAGYLVPTPHSGSANVPVRSHMRRPTLVEDAVVKGLAGQQGPVPLMLANLTTMIEHVHARLHVMDDRLKNIKADPVAGGAGGLFGGGDGSSDSEDGDDEEEEEGEEV